LGGLGRCAPPWLQGPRALWPAVALGASGAVACRSSGASGAVPAVAPGASGAVPRRGSRSLRRCSPL